MNILVTGASGFIGRHALRAIADKGLRPISLVRKGSKTGGIREQSAGFREADLRDLPALESALVGIEGVIHLAGLTRAGSFREFMDVNSEGVARLVRACRKQPEGQIKRIVYVSSLAAAGPGTPEKPRRESDPCEPVTDYGRSKREGELRLGEECGDIAFSVVRPPIVYGPGEKDLLTVFRMCQRGMVPVPRGADQFYSLVFGPDLAQVLADLVARDHPSGTVLNGAHEEALSYRELVTHIGHAVGRVPRMPSIPRLLPRLAAVGGSVVGKFSKRPPLINLGKLPEIFAPGWVCSTEELQKLLPDACTTSLAVGAQKTADWYRTEGWIR